jgi:hypothetical protein
MVNTALRPFYSRERDPVPILQEVRSARGSVRTGAENFGLTGIRSLNRPFLSQSLYRLSYRDPLNSGTEIDIQIVPYLIQGRDSSVGIATRYGLHGPGIESRLGRDFSQPSRPALGPK